MQRPNELCWTHKNQAEKQAFSYSKTAQCGSNTLDSSTQEVEGVEFLSSRPGWLIKLAPEQSGLLQTDWPQTKTKQTSKQKINK